MLLTCVLWQAPRNKRTCNGNLDDPVLPEGTDWQVAFLVARATGKEGKRYLVRWDGYGPKADTWQSEADLAGAKESVREFNERKDKEEKDEQEASKAKHAELVKKKREHAQVPVPLLVDWLCSAPCVLRLVSTPPLPHLRTDPACVCACKAHLKDMQASMDAHRVSNGGGKRKRLNESPWWKFFCRQSQDPESKSVCSCLRPFCLRLSVLLCVWVCG